MLKASSFKKTQRYFSSNLRRAALYLAVILASALVFNNLLGTGALAESIVSGAGLIADQNFYLYVKPGETVRYDIKKVSRSPSNTSTASNVLYNIYTYKNDNDDQSDDSCDIRGGVVNAADPVGSPFSYHHCLRTFTNTTSVGAVWRVVVKRAYPAEAGHMDPLVWNISVLDGSQPISGRVWTDVYRINQSAPPFSTYNDPPYNGKESADIEMWYRSREGYTYRVNQLQYNGMGSFFWANAYGNTYQNSCQSTYFSVEGGDTGPGRPYRSIDPISDDSSNRACGGGYKLFFSPPAEDLPEKSQIWSGAWEDWLNPTVKQPTISDISFDSTAPESRSGKLKFNVANYVGNGTIEFDTNGDGQFNQDDDVFAEVAILSGANEYSFDGKDKSGQDIPSNKEIKIKINLNKNAEIHFSNLDAEKRGGVKVNRLNDGPNDSSSTRNVIYWNDTKLADRTCNSNTPILDGTAGIDSSNGVHGWDWVDSQGNLCPALESAPNNPWGNNRVIEEWAYSPISVVADYSIPASLSSDLELTKELLDKKESYNDGETVSYRITLKNSGPDPAQNVEVTESFSDNLSYISHETAVGSYDPSTKKWTVPSIDVDQILTLQINLKIDSSPNEFNNQAEVTSSSNADPDSAPGNCDSSPEDDCASNSFKLEPTTPGKGKGIGIPITGILVGKIIAGATGIALVSYLGRDMYLRNQKKHKSER